MKMFRIIFNNKEVESLIDLIRYKLHKSENKDELLREIEKIRWYIDNAI
jgi:hypothetical protein